MREMVTVATLTIRGVDDELHRKLRVQAARHGRSMEAEVRAILADQLSAAPADDRLGSRIHGRFAGIGGAELDTTVRNETPRPAVFE